jgi:hypothetical protein
LPRHLAGLGRAVHSVAGAEDLQPAHRPLFERADVTSNTYYDWLMHNLFFLYAAQTVAGRFAATFKDFPPAQSAASFTLDDALAKMGEAAGGAGR